MSSVTTRAKTLGHTQKRWQVAALPLRPRDLDPLSPRRFGVCSDVMGKVAPFVIAAVAALFASVLVPALLSFTDTAQTMRGFLSLVALVVVFVVTFRRLSTPDRDGEG